MGISRTEKIFLRLTWILAEKFEEVSICLGNCSGFELLLDTYGYSHCTKEEREIEKSEGSCVCVWGGCVISRSQNPLSTKEMTSLVT